MGRRRGGGGGVRCSRPPLNADNARFFLLAALILLYLLCGAAVFSALERPSELRAHRLWDRALLNFTLRHRVSRADLSALLRQYEHANGAGIRVDALRPRWDFSGAFYFVGTVVSTIGFGMTTPVTTAGKIFLIFYGLLGCAATILFFNLFLERIITTLAYVMRWCHERRLRRAEGAGGGGGGGSPPREGERRRPPREEREEREEEEEEEEDRGLEGWKPSVYSVMLILGGASALIACGASALYVHAEGWSYADALYFCFVAFSTIGFGDLVSSQRQRYDSAHQDAYRLGNCLFILTGVCCIYSLFNVISIVIKQTLNWILARLFCPAHCCPCPCSCPCPCPSSPRGCWPPCCPRLSNKRPGARVRLKRNAVQPALTPPPPRRPAGRHRYADVSVETVCGDSETDAGPDGLAAAAAGRRLSGEMISVNDFTASNKVCLALLQKQLSETANQGPRQSQSQARVNGFSGGVGGFSGGVGALAFMNNRLQETSVDR